MREENQGERQLVEVIKALRSDIQQAMEDGVGETVHFNVNEIEVELKTAISKKVGGKGGGQIEFKVLGLELGKANVEAQGEVAQQNEHTIRLKLKPQTLNAKTGKYEGTELSDLD